MRAETSLGRRDMLRFGRRWGDNSWGRRLGLAGLCGCITTRGFLLRFPMSGADGGVGEVDMDTIP